MQGRARETQPAAAQADHTVVAACRLAPEKHATIQGSRQSYGCGCMQVRARETCNQPELRPIVGVAACRVGPQRRATSQSSQKPL